MGIVHCNVGRFQVGKLSLPPIIYPRVITRTVTPTRFYAQQLTLQSGSNKPTVETGSKHQPTGKVSPMSLTQVWQQQDKKWEPLGPVSELSLNKSPIHFKINNSGSGLSNKLQFSYELPEWAQFAGTPAAIYMSFNLSYANQQFITSTDNWKCLVDASGAFDAGVSVSAVGSYINAWALCYVIRIFGNLLEVLTSPSITVSIDAFFNNITTQDNDNGNLDEWPIDMRITVSGEATQVQPVANPAPDLGVYGWELVE